MNAQEKENWKEKVKNLKGEVSQITIKTAEGEITLTGEDAEEAYEKLKGHNFAFYSKDGKHHKKGNVFYLSEGDKTSAVTLKNIKEKDLIWITEEVDKDGVEKEVEVEVKDGEKKVTITTTKDGDETVEVLEGKKAEKYLEEHGGKEMVFGVHSPHVYVYKGDKVGKKLMWVDEEEIDDDGIKKKVKVEIVDGQKKVTVTTTENGEEKVELFEGEDADKYLDEHEELQFNDEDGNVMVLKSKDSKDKNFVWVEAFDEGEGKVEKKVNVEVIDGEKVITVVTTEDGEEKTVVLEGVDADKFLKTEKGTFHIIMSDDDSDEEEIMIKLIDADKLIDCDENHIKVFLKEKDEEKGVKTIKIKKVKKEKEEKDKK